MSWYTFSQPLTDSSAQDKFDEIFMTLAGPEGLALFGKTNYQEFSYFLHIPAQLESDVSLTSFLSAFSARTCITPHLEGKGLLVGHGKDSDLAR